MVFGTVINEKVQLSRRAATGLGPTERLAPNPAMNQYPYSWTPDGRLLYVERADHITGGSDIRALFLGDRSSQLLMSLPDQAFDVSVSPDGHGILYLGRESGLTAGVRSSIWKGQRWRLEGIGRAGEKSALGAAGTPVGIPERLGRVQRSLRGPADISGHESEARRSS